MPPRARAVVLAVAMTLGPALTAGCSAEEPPRASGSPVTHAEARLLAGLLHRNVEEGGADFVVTAPYGRTTVLTLHGEIDFRDGTGHAQAVTTFGDGRPDDVRTVVFTADDLWIGDLPALPAALHADGIGYLRRPLAVADDGHGAALLDVVATVLLRLGSPADDDPRAFLDGSYTWRGQRSIDGRLTSLFRLHDRRTIAVGAADDLLVQYATPLGSVGVEVTVTLSDHGPRTVAVPADDETALAADHPEIAAALGV